MSSCEIKPVVPPNNIVVPLFTSSAKCLLIPAQQQDQIIKGLEAARAKLKEKIATYKKEQVRVTNELHE
eukprot:m51a1_g9023 hypothetical protein (69) ;mRNA; f:191532-196442